MAGRTSALDQYNSSRRKEQNETIQGIDDLYKILLTERKDTPMDKRVINPTQKDFIQDPAIVKAYMGAGGSGKTMIGVAEKIILALMIPDSKWLIARRDYNDLKNTTMRKCYEMLARLPEGIVLDRVRTPPETVWLKPIATKENPNPAPSSITFMGLRDWVGSYEYCGIFVDELDEVESKYFWQLVSRLRYSPLGKELPYYPISAAFNPPPKTHWLYRDCMGVDFEGMQYEDGIPKISLHTPKLYENKDNLPQGYYENMDKMPEELRQRYQKGEWVDVYPGLPVVRQFNEKMHVNPKIAFKNHTLRRSWDFGYNRPFTLFIQEKTNGVVEVMSEYFGKQVTGPTFINHVQTITSQNYADNMGIEDCGDPAVNQEKDTGKMLNLLRDAGIEMFYRDVPMDISLQLLRKGFEELIDGEPSIQIHPCCYWLIAALKGGYHLKDDGVTPKKDGTYDHGVDTLRYYIYYRRGRGFSHLKAKAAAMYTNAKTIWMSKNKR